MNKKYAVAVGVLFMFILLQGQAFSQAGSISGIVTKDSNGAGIAGLNVNAWPYSGGGGHGAETQLDGSYTITNLSPGSYRVQAHNSDTDYVSEYYDDTVEYNMATPVEVLPAQDTPGINFGLSLGGTLEGRVYEEGTSNPIGDATVHAALIVDDGTEMSWPPDTTRQNGKYRFRGLPQGYYNIIARKDGYACEVLTDVFVEAGQTTTAGNIYLGTNPGSIEGYIKEGEDILTDLEGYLGVDVLIGDKRDKQVHFPSDGITNGHYSIPGLSSNYQYRVSLNHPHVGDVKYHRVQAELLVESGGVTSADLLTQPAIKISGQVTYNGSPVVGATITYWNDAKKCFDQSNTDNDGNYRLEYAAEGQAHLQVYPPPPYAMASREKVFSGDTENEDFILTPGSTLSGTVRDYNTGKLITGSLKVTYVRDYVNESEDIWRQTHAIDGVYEFTGLPEGVAELAVKPEVNTGYAWQLRYIYLPGGQDKTGVDFSLRKGALVSGSFKDADGQGVADLEVEARGSGGEDCWGETDVEGDFVARLAPGSVRNYLIGIEEMMDADWVGIPQAIEISSPNDDQVLEFVVYDSDDAASIEGTVSNPGADPKTSMFVVVAFEAGKAFDKEAVKTVLPVRVVGLAAAGDYELMVPPGNNYDLYLCVMHEAGPDIMSITMRDSLFSVSAGDTGQILVYDSEGGTVTGTVTCAGEPVLMATVSLENSAGEFVGFAETDENGVYHLYNVPEGDYYAASAWHPYYGTSDEVQTPPVMAEGDTVQADVSILAAPSGLSTFILSSSKLKLSWKDNSDGEDGFRIERKVNNGDFALLKTLGPNATRYTDRGLKTNRTYTYRVSAYGGEGSSGYSNMTRGGISTSSGPYIKLCKPTSGKKNRKVTIRGNNFGPKNSEAKVMFYKGKNRKYAKIRKWKNKIIQCKVPNLPKGKYRIKVINSKGQSNVKTFTIKK
jgi:hypothetical protein